MIRSIGTIQQKIIKIIKQVTGGKIKTGCKGTHENWLRGNVWNLVTGRLKNTAWTGMHENSLQEANTKQVTDRGTNAKKGFAGGGGYI